MARKEKATPKLAVYLDHNWEPTGDAEPYSVREVFRGKAPGGLERVTEPSMERDWQEWWCDALNAHGG